MKKRNGALVYGGGGSFGYNKNTSGGKKGFDKKKNFSR
jgi:hypothetical protein